LLKTRTTTFSRGPLLTLSLAPRCELGPHRGEICHQGEMLTPSFTPGGEHSQLFRIIEGRTENFTPRGQYSPLGDNFAAGVKVCP
jgi:hypothetical protein